MNNTSNAKVGQVTLRVSVTLEKEFKFDSLEEVPDTKTLIAETKYHGYVESYLLERSDIIGMGGLDD